MDLGYRKPVWKGFNYYTICTLTAVCCGLVWCCTNFSYDAEYQIAMAYRLLKGDRMFLEMWEPHQTSALFTAIYMWPYWKLMGTMTGIVLYLQICGILTRCGIALLLYRTLRGDLRKSVAYAIALLCFMISPKDYAIPEFGNLQFWFSVLFFCNLWNYLKKGKAYRLILGAVFLCLEVLCYPSCTIVLFGAVGILAKYSEHKKKDILVFIGVCAGLGLAVSGFFLLDVGPDVFLECVAGMLALEPSHTSGISARIAGYGKDMAQMTAVLGVVGLAGFCISMVLRKKSASREEERSWAGLWLLCCAAILLGGFLINILSARNRCAYSVIFLFMVGVGLWGSRRGLGEIEKRIYICGSVTGGLSFLATLLLTDLPLPVSGAYGLLAVSFALIPISGFAGTIPGGSVRKGLFCCFICFIGLLAFRCVWVRTTMTGRGQICSILSDLSIVRTGPALGIISNEKGVCIQRDSYPEWKELIRPGDKVWIVGSVADTLGYLYEDVEVAGPSVMSTPSYNEAILDYWRLNPEKYPDVVIAESYMGQLVYDLQINEWFSGWIEETYQPEYVVDGIYWKYYFRYAP